MRVFISQPMNGQSEKEIEQERECIAADIRKRYGDVEVIESFIEEAPHDANPLWYLAKSLESMSTADLVVFAGDWPSARGCRVENLCAVAYGIPIQVHSDWCDGYTPKGGAADGVD